MAIRVFVYSLLVISVLAFFASSEDKQKKLKLKEKPMIVFHDSIMYTLTEKSMTRIVQSKRAERYKTKDLMYDGKIITESKNGLYTDYMSADLIVKRNDDFKFLNNAKYNRENFIELTSDEILYNAKTKIATNSLPFQGRYYEHILNGSHLFFDTNKSILKAQQAHFEVELEE